MPAVSRRWTASEVRQLIADNPLYTPRYDLVDGELLVTPSPAPKHQTAVLELAFALRQHLGERGAASVHISPSDVELEPEFLSQPRSRVLDCGSRRTCVRVFRAGSGLT